MAFIKVQLTAKVYQHFGVQHSKFIIRYLIRSWSLPFRNTVQRGYFRISYFVLRIYNDIHLLSSFKGRRLIFVYKLINFHMIVSAIIYFIKFQLTVKVYQNFGVHYSKFIIRYLVRSWSLSFRNTFQRGYFRI